MQLRRRFPRRQAQSTATWLSKVPYDLSAGTSVAAGAEAMLREYGVNALTSAIISVLLDVVLALQTRGGLADLLHRRQQEADQDRYDRYHLQQLDQGEDTRFIWGTPG
jgi:hypothetical protein